MVTIVAPLTPSISDASGVSERSTILSISGNAGIVAGNAGLSGGEVDFLSNGGDGAVRREGRMRVA